jgi:hypothetical protein
MRLPHVHPAPRQWVAGTTRHFRAEPLEPRLLLAIVQGFKFDDLDGDGTRDAGEPALAGFVIYHDENNDNVRNSGESTATTDGNGFFLLSVPAGTGPGGANPTIEVIREVPKDGWRLTAPAGGEHQLGLTSTSTRQDINFLNTQRALVTGVVYHDMNINGEFDAGDLALRGWFVFADVDRDGVRHANDPADITDDNGVYSLNVAPSPGLLIRVVAQPDWAFTEPATGTDIVVAGAGAFVQRHFGVTQRAIVSGLKFNDLDGDGTRDATEPGLAGWRVFADLDEDGIFDASEPSAVSDVNGNFSINVQAGHYVFREVAQPGWRPTHHFGEFAQVLPPGVIVTRHFGNTQLGLVSGQVIRDDDADGVADAGEPGQAARVYLDLDDDGSFDAGEPSVDSSVVDGRYEFPVQYLPSPQTYHVRTVPPAGFRSTGAAVQTVTFDGPAQVRDDRDFLVTNRQVIAGLKYDDQNADGNRDAGEPGLGGWRVYVDRDNDGVADAGEPSALTDASGNFRIVLPPLATNDPVEITLREVAQAAWRQTAPLGTGAHTFEIANGRLVAARNFGNTQAPAPRIVNVFARGSSWAGDDGNANNLTFREYLDQAGLGNVVFGYRVAAGDVLPWVNVNQLVLRYDWPVLASVLAGQVVVDGVRSDYTATPAAPDGRSVLVRLDRPLGRLPGGGENGDRIRLSVAGGGAGGANFELAFNALQGDVDGSGSVLAADFSGVKRKFFRTTNDPGPAGDARYSPFHDVDGSGGILADDFSAVKARFFDSLPTSPVAAVTPPTARRLRDAVTSALLA